MGNVRSSKEYIRGSRRIAVRGGIAVVALICAYAPVSAGAAVKIGEIMYDLEGSDSGREWVEILNEGSVSVDVSGFKLFEANTNHALTLVSGSAVLVPGGVAVIADNPSTFLNEWPSFSGTLFDSSFSLSNTGEQLALRTQELVDEDAVSYSSDMGAAGDGMSLVRSGTSFVPKTPTPGTGAASSGGASTESSAPAAAVSGTAAQAASLPDITARAGGSRSVAVGAAALFSGEALGIDDEPLPSARFVWNFGDGEIAEGKDVFHTYSYPGRYTLFLSVSSGGYSATDRAIVRAVPAQVSVRDETDGSISVFNRGAEELDLSFWIIARGDRTFTIPKHTYVSPGGGLRFSSRLLLFPLEGAARLLYPNGSLAASAEERTGEDLIASGGVVRVEGLPQTAPAARAETFAPAPSPAHSPAPVSAAPTLQAASVGAFERAEGVYGEERAAQWPWVAGLLLVLLIGAFGAWATYRREERENDPELPAGTAPSREDALSPDEEARRYRIMEEGP